MTTPDLNEARRLAGSIEDGVAAGAYKVGSSADCAPPLLRALSDELERLRAQVVPAGWKMVPVEPTQAMLDAVVTTLDDHMLGDAAEKQYREDWAAMLAAARAQQAEQSQWAGAVAFIEHAQNVAGTPGRWADEFLAWYKPDDWFGEHRAAAVFLGEKLAAQQAAPSLTVGEREAYPPCKGMNCGATDGKSHSAECFAEHAATIAGGVFVPNGGAKPMAWFSIEHGEADIEWNSARPTYEGNWRPLYTHAQPAAQAEPVATSPRTEFVLNELRSALNAMLTFFGMDEDEGSKEVFAKARQAYDYAQIVMRPLEPWERQSLEDFRRAVHRWHEKAVAKGYDGVEALCEQAQPAAQPATMRALGADGKPFEPATQEQPLFWYRPCGDGLYEGPHHHNSVGGKMLREEKPGAWVPLYPGAAPSNPPAQGVDTDERAAWFAVAMNAAAYIEDAAASLRDPDAKAAATGAAKHVREKCQALWFATPPVAHAPAAQGVGELSPVETIRYWADAYASPASGEHFTGHGMVVALLREYLTVRTAQAPAAEPLTDEQIEAVFCERLGISKVLEQTPDTFRACKWFKRGYRAALAPTAKEQP